MLKALKNEIKKFIRNTSTLEKIYYALIILVSTWFLVSWGEVIYHSSHSTYEYSPINLFNILLKLFGKA